MAGSGLVKNYLYVNSPLPAIPKNFKVFVLPIKLSADNTIQIKFQFHVGRK